MRFPEDMIASGVRSSDERDGRVYGWIPGVVTDIDTKLMRVKARIGKQEDNDSTDWLVPVGMGSIESVPEKNDPIGVIFADGDPHRGAYFYFPQSTTQSRPTSEPIPLGLTFVGMFNYLVTQFNQLRSDFAGHTHTFSGTTASSCTAGGATGTCTGSTAGKTTTAVPANKGKTSDGSVVADKSSSEIVLAKRSKVR